jgi:hypothetical protein
MQVPLATYDEARSDGRRRFEVYPDRILVSGGGSGMKFETTVSLADLKPEPDRLWIRNRFFFWGVVVLAMGLVLFVPKIDKFADGIQPGETFAFYFGLAFGIVGLIICLKTVWKIEFARFQSRQGGIVVLDVARAGPDRARFSGFIELLVDLIRKTQTPDEASRFRTF